MPDKNWYRLISIRIDLRIEPDDDNPQNPALLQHLKMESILNSDGEELSNYRNRAEVPNQEDVEVIEMAHAIMDSLGEYLAAGMTGNTTRRMIEMMREIVKAADDGEIAIHDEMGNYKPPSQTELPDEIKALLKKLGLDV